MFPSNESWFAPLDAFLPLVPESVQTPGNIDLFDNRKKARDLRSSPLGMSIPIDAWRKRVRAEPDNGGGDGLVHAASHEPATLSGEQLFHRPCFTLFDRTDIGP